MNVILQYGIIASLTGIAIVYVFQGFRKKHKPGSKGCHDSTCGCEDQQVVGWKKKN